MEVDAATATVTVGTREDLLRDRVPLQGLDYRGDGPPDGARVTVQMRAHGTPVHGVLRVDGGDPGRVVVDLVDPSPRVAPGQVVALYDGDVVIGCATAA